MDSFATVLVLSTFVDQRVGFVDEQHSIKRFIDLGVGFGSGLTGVLGNQAAAVGFHQVAFFKDAQRAVNFGDDSRNGCLTGSRVANKRHVQTWLGRRQAFLCPQRLHFQKVGQRFDLIFDVIESNQTI